MSTKHGRLALCGTASSKFEVVGWESVRGTARRPQEAINELIHECHYLVALFKKSWGSEPGSPWGYTSGTEEELFTGLLDLGQDDRPMRDVWVAFISDPDPAPQIGALGPFKHGQDRAQPTLVATACSNYPGQSRSASGQRSDKSHVTHHPGRIALNF